MKASDLRAKRRLQLGKRATGGGHPAQREQRRTASGQAVTGARAVGDPGGGQGAAVSSALALLGQGIALIVNADLPCAVPADLTALACAVPAGSPHPADDTAPAHHAPDRRANEAMPRPSDEDLFQSSTMTFGEHLEELRICLIRAAIGLVLAVLVGFFVARPVVHLIEQPLPENSVTDLGDLMRLSDRLLHVLLGNYASEAEMMAVFTRPAAAPGKP